MAQNIQHKHNALMLVEGELQQSLELALQALNIYIDSPEDNSALTSCIKHLHQIDGTIDILNLDGAKLLSNEMLAVASALNTQSCDDIEQAQEILVHALLLLPNYLQLLSTSIQDHPLCLLETVNQLRTTHHQDDLDASSLFKPALASPLPERITPKPNQPIPKIGIANNKVSHAFQLSLLNWLRNEDENSLGKMRSITRYLRLICQQERTTIFWWAAETVIEALLEKNLAVSPQIKLTLGKLNQPIKILTGQNEQQLVALFPSELEKALLLLVARVSSNTDNIRQLKETFNLHFFDHRQKIYGMSNNALNDANLAILDELHTIKEQISQYDTNNDVSTDWLEQIAQQLSPLVDTLQLLTEYTASHILKSQVDELNALTAAQKIPDEQQLMQLADSVLNVESMLQPASTDSQTSEHKQLQFTVISECLFELGNVKETLSTQAEATNKDNSLLNEIATQLELIAGSLTMLNLNDAAATLEKTGQQMLTCVANNHELSPAKLDLFAEVIAACDLYLEGLNQHGQALNQFLDTANNKLADFDSLLNPNTTEQQSPAAPETLAEIETIPAALESAESDLEVDIEPTTVLELETESLELSNELE
ncbi:hypothetical protein A9Q78_01765, partial [Methylophaga sp. 41_12_T18]